jgi:tetratricopeptide (TPR) repeat protein/tRNA A-37 threonylcarbamoyl transferase component Bud32
MDWAKIDDIYQNALDLAPSERDAYVRGRCAGDPELYREVRSLLSAYDEQESFALPPAPPPSRSGEKLGAWFLVRLIGRGGMGAVYEAERVEGGFKQRAAVKLLDPSLASPLFAQRFEQERQIQAGLNHPHIARILDGGMTPASEPYLVMEFVEGRPLGEYVESAKLDLRQRIGLFLQICSAVDYAHRHLIVHRDLKPDNVLVQEDGHAKLLDFGTAKLVGREFSTEPGQVTRHGIHTFTPEYASPEQVLGKPVSTASDLYSLGIMLYELTAGRLPYTFKDYSMGEMIHLICEYDPPPPGADADLNAIVLKAIRKEPQERYGTTDALQADLRAWLEGRPVAARQGDLRYRLAKFAARNRALTLALALAALLLFGGTAGIAWQARIARKERDRAEARFQDLHRLSNTLLLELNDAVAQLPGSTEARRLIVSRGLDYLDKLARDAGNDAHLRVELADAYLKLGNLLGNPYDQNLGDPEAALRSYGKALEALAGAGDSAAARRMAGRAKAFRGEVLFTMGKAAEAVASSRAGCEEQEAASKTPDELAETAACYDSLSDQYGQRGTSSLQDREEALKVLARVREIDERVLALNPQHQRAIRGLAIAEMKTGGHLRLDDPARALDHFQAALARLEKLPAAERGSLRSRRIRGFVYSQMGRTHLDRGDRAAALESFTRARELYEPLAAVDPNNAQAQFDLAVQVNLQGLTYDEMGDRERAAESYRRVLALVGELERKGQAPPSAQGNAAELLVRLARMNAPGGDARRGLETIRRLADPPGASFEALERAARMLLWMPAGPYRDSAAAVAYARRGVTATKAANPEAWLTLAETLEASGAKEAAREAARNGLALPLSAASPVRAKLEALAR